MVLKHLAGKVAGPGAEVAGPCTDVAGPCAELAGPGAMLGGPGPIVASAVAAVVASCGGVVASGGVVEASSGGVGAVAGITCAFVSGHVHVKGSGRLELRNCTAATVAIGKLSSWWLGGVAKPMGVAGQGDLAVAAGQAAKLGLKVEGNLSVDHDATVECIGVAVDGAL